MLVVMWLLMNRNDSFAALDGRLFHRRWAGDAMELVIESFCLVRSTLIGFGDVKHTTSVADCVATLITPPQRSYIRPTILARQLSSVRSLRGIAVGLALGNRGEGKILVCRGMTICSPILRRVQRAG